VADAPNTQRACECGRAEAGDVEGLPYGGRIDHRQGAPCLTTLGERDPSRTLGTAARSEPGEGGELKPCPFCGAEPYLAKVHDEPEMWGVYCHGAGGLLCNGNPSTFASRNVGDVIAAWNKRAPDPRDAEITRLRGEVSGSESRAVGHLRYAHDQTARAEAAERERDEQHHLACMGEDLKHATFDALGADDDCEDTLDVYAGRVRAERDALKAQLAAQVAALKEAREALRNLVEGCLDYVTVQRGCWSKITDTEAYRAALAALEKAGG